MSNQSCPIRDCKEPVMPEKLMCLKHWKEVPPSLQRRVYVTWRSFMQSRKPLVRKQCFKNYVEARQAAIDSFSSKNTNVREDIQ